MERIKKRPQRLMTLMADLPALPLMRPMARAYSHHGHGPRADQTGRIHISDFRTSVLETLLRTAAGPYIRVKVSRSHAQPR